MPKTRMLPTKKSKEGRGVGYRLNWKGEDVMMRMTYGAGVIMAAQMFQAEIAAKSRLTPGHGKDTGTMQRRTHVAAPGYNWNADNVEASEGSAPLGGQIVLPDLVRGKLALELGCGQVYTIFYHQMHDPFLRIAFDNAMKDFEIQSRGPMADGIQVEVSAWVAVRQYFLSQSSLTSPDIFGTQIAGRHKYSIPAPTGWTPGSLGFTIKPDTGPAELYVDDSTQRFECRIYGEDGFAIEQAYMKVKEVIKNFQRIVVDNALIHRLYAETTPMFLEDPDLNLPFYMFFISASVAEKGVKLCQAFTPLTN